MKKIAVLCFLLSAAATCAWAQGGAVSGQVTDAADGSGLPGVNVLVKGTTIGTVTDIEGNYTLEVPEYGETLVFSFMGMKTEERSIGGRTSIDVTLGADVEQLSEVVVTALGISREKRSLGYSTQEVSGDAINNVKTANYVNSLSGKLSGVQIKRNNNFGGSTNVLIRGAGSLVGSNQALFVIDGVPISNRTENNRSQEQGGGGNYDYGNAAADLNPEDIESVNVLKGAAATALYGSRASNGVIVINTKKGGAKKGKPGIGVTVSSAVTVGAIDRSTFPTYQQRYGAGYGGQNHFRRYDMNGDGKDDDVVDLTADASYGGRFDPNLMVYQWENLYLKQEDRQARPWMPAENGPITFFETPIKLTNSVSLSKGFDKGSFRMGYTNFYQEGLMPNSDLRRNNLSLNMNYQLSDRLTATGFGNYIKTEAVGRNSTGYSGGNIMTSFRQWWQTNVDIKRLKDFYESTGRNATWNPRSETTLSPIYWDNPYWVAHRNYASDERSRFLGIVSLDYKVTDWLHVFGRAAIDTYDELQEERKEEGSKADDFGLNSGGGDRSTRRNTVGSGYLKRVNTFSETNYDVMLNFDKDIIENRLNLKAIVGANYRQTNRRSTTSATGGGIVVPGLFSLQNTKDPLPYPYEIDSKVGVIGVYANASLGYDNFVFLDATVRRDESSTLPKANNSYWYPSVSTSFVFSRFIDSDVIHFGKLRANYAEVGSSAPFDQLLDQYDFQAAFNGTSAAPRNTKRNSDLKPERSASWELGLEMDFLEDRAGFDVSLYRTATTDQLVPLKVSEATGYLFRFINAGEIRNEGIEVTAFGVPFRTPSGFEWRVDANWTTYASTVVELYNNPTGAPVENYLLGSFQGGVSVNAAVNEPYGVIKGTNYIYTESGRRVINSERVTYTESGQRAVNSGSGQYARTTANDRVIGNVVPDWTGGITNTFRYKNVSLSFLIDVQYGGDIFSLDMSYGLATGLYPETDFTNDLGNPVRNSLEDGGGYVNTGAVVNEESLTKDEKSGQERVPDSKVITDTGKRIDASQFGAFGYIKNGPNAEFIYDASYVKLREVTLSYSLPQQVLENTFLNGVTFSFVGSNLWIIHKNLPYADPESGLGAGNLQGYSVGSLPTTRDFTFNVKLKF